MTEQAICNWKTLENQKLGNFTTYKLNSIDRFVSGFMGGAVNAALFVTPVEYIRNAQITQMNQSQGVYGRMLKPPGPMQVIKSTILSNGVSGLWRGMASTVLRDSLGCGCFFAALAYTQQLLTQNHKDRRDGPPSNSVLVTSGAVAGVAFWLVGLPLDTMKTWIQNGTARNLQHAWQLAQQEGFMSGISSLNRGWQVAYGRGAPAAAITVTTYSLVYSALSKNQCVV